MRFHACLAAVVVSGVAALTHPARADDVREGLRVREDIGNVWRLSVVSDYVARGLSQTWGKPAGQFRFDHVNAGGWHAGVFVSGVSRDLYPGADAVVELHGGQSWAAPADWRIVADAIYSLYPGANWSNALCARVGGCPSQTFDTGQVRLQAVGSRWTAGVSYALSDYFGRTPRTGYAGGTQGTTYWEIDYGADAIGLARWRWSLHAGYTHVAARSLDATGATRSADTYDWSVGFERAVQVMSQDARWGLTYTQTFNHGQYDHTPSLVSSSTYSIGRPALVAALSLAY
ncbi:MAG: TorF family putative porin [Burkholderiales bacterium]